MASAAPISSTLPVQFFPLFLTIFMHLGKEEPARLNSSKIRIPPVVPEQKDVKKIRAPELKISQSYEMSLSQKVWSDYERDDDL